MTERQPPVVEETSFLQARFQTAIQQTALGSGTRRANRVRLRARLRPPGFVPPTWAVAAPFTYDVGHEGSAERYVVPAGFAFDGASVPLLLTIFVPRAHSSYMGAAALHDYLYVERYADVPRARADAIFREAMLVSGLHWVWAGLMWRSVRAGGWGTWYLRKPGTRAHRLLTAPAPLGQLAYVAGTAALFLLGVLAVDLWNVGRYRAMAREVAARDVASVKPGAPDRGTGAHG